MGALLALLVTLCYLPALRGGFIWDDDAHLTENACITGPLGFKGIWTTSSAVYYPLVLTSFWVQHALWGLHPLPYHLINILMQALAAVLLWRVLLTLKVPGAWLGAALWALHPVQVESVAWITELKNTQSGVFFLLAILAYIKWLGAGPDGAPGRRTKLYLLVLLSAVLAMLSKASTVMLPVVLGLVAWWVEGRWRWHRLLSLIPVFLFSAAASAWTIWEQKYSSGAIGEEWSQTLPERVIIAGKVVWFYLGKLVWPHPVMFIYPRWHIDGSDWISFVPALAVVGLLGWFWWKRNGWARPWFLAFAFFLALLFPVMGFFNVYFFRYSFVGDHFQYLAGMGPLALAGAGIARLAVWLRQRNPLASEALPLVVVGALALLAWRHTHVFRNDEFLWRDTLRKNPNAWLAFNNLGSVLMTRADLEGAIACFRRTLELHPNYPEAEANLGNALSDAGRVEEAIPHYQRAAELNPEHIEIRLALGAALVSQGRAAEAEEHFQWVVSQKPDSARAHDHLASVLAIQGRMEEATSHFQEALRLNPHHPRVRMNYGSALATQGKYAEAARQFVEVLRVAPNTPAACKNLGSVLLQLGQTNDAAAYFREALRLDPSMTTVREQLELLESEGKR